MRSPCSGSRTRAVTWCPARTTESSTADPMYPVAPVRKIRIAEPRILQLDVPDPLAVEERDDPVFAHLEDRAEPSRTARLTFARLRQSRRRSRGLRREDAEESHCGEQLAALGAPHRRSHDRRHAVVECPD